MNFVFYLHDEQDPVAFEKQLLWFKKRYNLIGINDVEDIVYNGKKLSNACHLTVDDGWRSTYEVIYPIMKKHGIPFTMFVSPKVLEEGMNFWYYTMRFCNQDVLKQIMVDKGYYMKEAMKYPFEMLTKEISIDDVYSLLNEYQSAIGVKIDRGFCNLDEVKEMQASGLVEIGAHTLTHPILAAENDERSETEIKDSVKDLSSILDKKVKTFAYPNGMKGPDFGEREMTYAKEVGLRMAFSVDPGVLSSDNNTFAIPRWGSMARIKFGPLGKYLPSRMNQKGVRAEILKCRLK